jgi:hypothetical protein
MTRDAWGFAAVMCFIFGWALLWFGATFGGTAAFGAFFLMLFSFSAGVAWAGMTGQVPPTPPGPADPA